MKTVKDPQQRKKDKTTYFSFGFGNKDAAQEAWRSNLNRNIHGKLGMMNPPKEAGFGRSSNFLILRIGRGFFSGKAEEGCVSCGITSIS
jgi:hypothetical protein